MIGNRDAKDATGRLSRQKPKKGFLSPPMQPHRYMLEQGQVDQSLVPRNAETVSLGSDQKAEQATYDILHECLEQIAANKTVVQDLGDLEGPHQLRVGLRRLRSAIAALSIVVDSPENDATGAGGPMAWPGGREVARY
jgi:hypothetical protein